jgi:hypothetical protein
MMYNVCDQPFCYCSGVSNLIVGNQLRESLRRWVTPPDPSTNHNIATDIHHGETAEWFSQGSILAEWKSTGSLLWIYGKRMFFSLFPDRPLTAVCVLSWLWQEHPLVRRRSASTHVSKSLLYPLVLRSSKMSSLYAKQGQP